MLKIHKMPLKNQFQSRIISAYDKTPNLNDPQPFTGLSFTGDCTVDFLGKERCLMMTSSLAGIAIVDNTIIKTDAAMIPIDGDFESFRFHFEIETAKSNKFRMIFTSYTSCYGDTAIIKLTE